MSSVYLSVTLLSKVGCFRVDLPSLGTLPTDSFPDLVPASALITVIACTVAFAASMVVCVNA